MTLRDPFFGADAKPKIRINELSRQRIVKTSTF